MMHFGILPFVDAVLLCSIFLPSSSSSRSSSSRRMLCLDDEHSHHPSERDRHICRPTDADDGPGRRGWHSNVIRQRLRSVRLSHVAHEKPALGFPEYIHLRHIPHDSGALSFDHLPDMVPQ